MPCMATPAVPCSVAAEVYQGTQRWLRTAALERSQQHDLEDLVGLLLGGLQVGKIAYEVAWRIASLTMPS